MAPRDAEVSVRALGPKRSCKFRNLRVVRNLLFAANAIRKFAVTTVDRTANAAARLQ